MDFLAGNLFLIGKDILIAIDDACLVFLQAEDDRHPAKSDAVGDLRRKGHIALLSALNRHIRDALSD